MKTSDALLSLLNIDSSVRIFYTQLLILVIDIVMFRPNNSRNTCRTMWTFTCRWLCCDDQWYSLSIILIILIYYPILGFTTAHMTHRQVIDYIKSCGNQVTFTIDPTIPFPRYATQPTQQNGSLNGPIESEDAVYTTSNQYGTLTNGHNGTHHLSNGNIAMGTGLDYLNQDDRVS